MTIGFISPIWLPRWGGAEQYHERLARLMIEAGLPLRVLCATAAEEGRDNGAVAVERHVPDGNFRNVGWSVSLDNDLAGHHVELAKQYAFMDHAVDWCRRNGVRVALIGSPLQCAHMYHARELYLRLKDMGIRVGLIHHDLPGEVQRRLTLAYRDAAGGWEEAGQKVLAQLGAEEARGGVLQCALSVGSPMVFEPDFVIANSHWSARFIDPGRRVPTFVLHPRVDAAWWTAAPGAQPLARSDVLMINPQTRKGPSVMKSVIARAAPGTRFRVLRGGWGESFKVFAPAISDLPAWREGRVELLDYVPDMRAAYRAAGALLFPSIAEGYGLTPVEAMACGTPVVSSNHPAICEAVGEGALTLCPQKDGPSKWHAAVEEVLRDPAPWRARGQARFAHLVQRQDEERAAFLSFMSTVAGGVKSAAG